MEPLLIAHRGDSAHAPENTIPAFEAALEKGAEWIEMDLQLAADDTVVISHDEGLWRRARRRGRVEALTAAELGAIDVSRGFSRFLGATVPTLEATLRSVGRRGSLYLELKSRGGGRRNRINARLLERCLQAVPRSSRHALASFDPGLVRGALQEGRRAVLILSDPAVLDRLSAGERARLHAVSARGDCIDPAFVARVARSGPRLWAWTLDGERKIHRALRLGVSGICSNDVAQSRGILDAWMERMR